MNLDELKKLAGINEFQRYQAYQGSNISITGTEKRELEKSHNIKPGTPEWFRLWFSKPYLTGETPVKESFRYTAYEMAIMEGGHSLDDI